MLTRRSLLSGSAAGAASVALAACATMTDPTTGVTSYGLPANVLAFIQGAVAQISAYAPTVESIIGTAISLFGPQYASLVAIGSSAINLVIGALTNLIKPPAAGRLAARRRGDRYGRRFVGWTAQHVPVYAQ